MAEHWAVDFLEAVRQPPSQPDGLMFATVATVEPITIRLHDQVVSQHLHISASLHLYAGDSVLVLKQGVNFYLLVKVVAL